MPSSIKSLRVSGSVSAPPLPPVILEVNSLSPVERQSRRPFAVARTLLLTRTEVAALLDPTALVPALRSAFVDYSARPEDRARRVRSALPGPGSATVLFPGVAPGTPAYTVKVHAKFPDQQPAIRGVLCLHAMDTGELLAVTDSTYITSVRTGLVGALAAHTLARPDADTAAVVGAGVPGGQQPPPPAAPGTLRLARSYDTAAGRAESFARAMTAELGIRVEPTDSVEAAVRGAGIVLAATWAREAFILPGMLAPGAHVTTLGADEPGKAEVS